MHDRVTFWQDITRDGFKLSLKFIAGARLMHETLNHEIFKIWNGNSKRN